MICAVTYGPPSKKQLEEFKEYKETHIQGLGNQIKSQEEQIASLREKESQFFFSAKKAKLAGPEEEIAVEFTPN